MPPQNPRQSSDPEIDRILSGYVKDKVNEEADRQGVPRDYAQRIAQTESAYKPDVIKGQRRSSAGALGPMQLMPGTAKDLKVDPYNVNQNIEGGVRYAGEQLRAFGNDQRKASAAYNWGPGNVRKYGVERAPAETQNYMRKVAGQSQQADPEIEDLLKQYQQEKGAQQQPDYQTRTYPKQYMGSETDPAKQKADKANWSRQFSTNFDINEVGPGSTTDNPPKITPVPRAPQQPSTQVRNVFNKTLEQDQRAAAQQAKSALDFRPAGGNVARLEEQSKGVTRRVIASPQDAQRMAAREQYQQLSPAQRLATRVAARLGGAAPKQIEEVARPVTDIEQAAGSFARGVGDVTGAAIRGVPSVVRNPYMPTLPKQGVAGATDELARRVDRGMQAVAPVNPDDQGWMTTKIPRAAGSVVPFVAGGALTGGSAAAPAVMGALASAGQYRKDVADSGKQIAPGRYAAGEAFAVATGLTEALGIGRALNKMGVAKPVIERAAQILEESGQEYAQKYLEDINAKLVAGYDPSRSLSPTDPAKLEAAALGAILGGGMAAPSIPGDVRAQREARVGAQQVAREPQRPMNLTPTAVGPTERVKVTPGDFQRANLETQKGFTEPLAEPLAPPQVAPTAPITPAADAAEAAPAAAGMPNRADFEPGFVGDMEYQAALVQAQRAPKAAKPAKAAAAKPAYDPTAFRGAIDDAKIQAGEAEAAGNWEAARDQYRSAMDTITEMQKEARRNRDAKALTELAREKSATNTNWQVAKRNAERAARQQASVPQVPPAQQVKALVLPTGDQSAIRNPQSAIENAPTRELSAPLPASAEPAPRTTAEIPRIQQDKIPNNIVPVENAPAREITSPNIKFPTSAESQNFKTQNEILTPQTNRITEGAGDELPRRVSRPLEGQPAEVPQAQPQQSATANKATSSKSDQQFQWGTGKEYREYDDYGDLVTRQYGKGEGEWTISDNLGGRAFGDMRGGEAFITRMDSVPPDKKYLPEAGGLKRRGFFRDLIRTLQNNGAQRINISLQSTDTRAAIARLLETGELINPRGVRGSSGNEHPTIFDIPRVEDKAAPTVKESLTVERPAPQSLPAEAPEVPSAAADRLARLRAAAQQAPPMELAQPERPSEAPPVNDRLERLKRIANQVNQQFAQPEQPVPQPEAPKAQPEPVAAKRPPSPTGEPKLSNRVVKQSLQEEMGATSTNRSDKLRLSGPSENYREVVTRWEDAPEGTVFRKPEHYGDETNVLFDRRLEDRKTTNGDNAVFFMEAQSDWHQSKDAPPAPMRNTWLRRALDDTAREAAEAGQDGVLLPKTVEQLYEIQRWGAVKEKDGRYTNSEGFDITPVVRRYLKELPDLAKRAANKSGVRLETRTVDNGRGGKEELWFLPVKKAAKPAEAAPVVKDSLTAERPAPQSLPAEAPTRFTEYEGGEVQRYSKPLEGQPVEVPGNSALPKKEIDATKNPGDTAQVNATPDPEARFIELHNKGLEGNGLTSSDIGEMIQTGRAIGLPDDAIRATIADARAMQGERQNTQAIEKVGGGVLRAPDGSLVIIHPSTRNPGQIQVSRFKESGIISDSQAGTIADAVRLARQTGHTEMVTGPQAEEALMRSITAQSDYEAGRTPSAQSQSSRPSHGYKEVQLETPEAAIKFGEGGFENGFAIERKGGARIDGFVKNADFPGDIDSPTRGEIHYTDVPEGERRRGLGTSLTIDALNLMRANGVKTVTINGVSKDGRATIEALQRRGIISAPIRTAPTGKSEYRILLGEKPAPQYSPEEAALREREALPPIERRRALRDAVPRGQFGKLSEAAYFGAPRNESLAGNAQLRRLLDLPEMPPYRLPDAPINPKTGEPYTNPAWVEAAQDTLNALAALAGKERSSQINFGPGELSGGQQPSLAGKINPQTGKPYVYNIPPKGQPTRGEAGDLYLAVQELARRRGEQIEPSLRAAFKGTVESARTAKAGYEAFVVDERLGDIENSLREIYRRGKPSREENKAHQDAFREIAAEYGVSTARADAAFAEIKAQAATRAERRRAAQPAGANQGEGERRSGRVVGAVEQRATGTDGRSAEGGGRAAVQEAKPIEAPDAVKSQVEESLERSPKGQKGEPWQLTQADWEAARNGLRPETFGSAPKKASVSAEVGNMNQLEQLLYGVRDQDKARLKAAMKGDITLTPDELEEIQDRLNTRVSHRDVIEKALAEGKPVPPEVLADYPDLQSKAAKPAPTFDTLAQKTTEGPAANLSRQEWGQVKHDPNTGLYWVTTFDNVGATREGYSLGRSQGRGKQKRTVAKTFESKQAAETYLDKLYARELKAGRIPAAPEKMNVPSWVDKEGKTRPALGEVEILPQTAQDKEDGFRRFRPVGENKQFPRGGTIEEAWYQSAKQATGASVARPAKSTEQQLAAVDEELAAGVITEKAAATMRERIRAAAKPKFVADAEARLADYKSGRQLGGGQQLLDQAIASGYKVYRAGMDFAQWSAEVIKDAGEAVKPQLQMVWDLVRDRTTDAPLVKAPIRKTESDDSARLEGIQSRFDSLRARIGVPKSPQSGYGAGRTGNQEAIALPDRSIPRVDPEKIVYAAKKLNERITAGITATSRGAEALRANAELLSALNQRPDGIGGERSASQVAQIAAAKEKAENAMRSYQESSEDMAIAYSKQVKDRPKARVSFGPLPDEPSGPVATMFGGQAILDALKKAKDAQSFGELPKTRADVENSPRFKRWFGDSKVVDEKGKPLVVYHGTAGSFDRFKKSGANQGTQANTKLADLGFFFTPSAESASEWASSAQPVGSGQKNRALEQEMRTLQKQIPGMQYRGEHEQLLSTWKRLKQIGDEMAAARTAKAPNVMPVYLSLKNPARLSLSDIFNSKTGGDIGSFKQLAARLQRQGYDGAIIQADEFERNSDAFDEYTIKEFSTPQYVAFKPNQIKSAIGNSGAFNPESGSILSGGIPGQQILDNLRAGRRKIPPKTIPADFNAQAWIRKAAENLAKQTLSDADKAKVADPNTTAAEKAKIYAAAKIDPAQQAAFQTAMGEAFAALSANDYNGFQDAANRLKAISDAPATNWEKASAIRKAAMLSRPVSHLRNLIGNTAFQNLEEVARIPGSIGDAMLSAATGRRTLQGASVEDSARAIYAAATDGVTAAKDAMKGRSSEEIAKALQTKEVNFNNKAVDKAVKFVFRSLGAEDQIFYVGAYDRAIREVAKLTARNEARQGIIKRADLKARQDALLAAPTPQMEIDAALAAETAVFRNDNALSSAISRVREGASDKANFALDLVLPFDRTPTNVVLRALEYSPLGVARGAVKGVAGAGRAIAARRAAKKAGTPSKADIQAAIDKAFTPAQQRSAAQLLGRGTVGSGLLALGYALAAKGLMTGFYDDEDYKGEAMKRATGAQPLAIQIGGRWYGLGGIGPLALALGLGATFHDESKKKDADFIGAAAAATKEMIMQLPQLETVNQLSKNISRVSKDRANLGKVIGSLASSFVPGVVNDVGQSIPYVRDPFEREVKDDPKKVKGFRRAVREGAGQVGAKLPGVRRMLPVKKDITGKPVPSRPLAPIDPFSSRPATGPLPRRR